MNIAVIAIMYGLLLYVLLGGFLLTVCTDYPEHLREYRELLLKAYRGSYYKVVLLTLFWYIVGIGVWPYFIRKYRA